MPEPVAWDCQNPRCRARNSWTEEHCHECRWPRYSGQPLSTVPFEEPKPELHPVPHPSPLSRPPATVPPLPGWAWALGGVAGFTLLMIAPGVVLIGLFFALLWAMALGIWRIAMRPPR